LDPWAFGIEFWKLEIYLQREISYLFVFLKLEFGSFFRSWNLLASLREIALLSYLIFENWNLVLYVAGLESEKAYHLPFEPLPIFHWEDLLENRDTMVPTYDTG
jgi:hypothetical protein